MKLAGHFFVAFFFPACERNFVCLAALKIPNKPSTRQRSRSQPVPVGITCAANAEAAALVANPQPRAEFLQVDLSNCRRHVQPVASAVTFEPTNSVAHKYGVKKFFTVIISLAKTLIA